MPFDRERQYFEEHLRELLEHHEGKYVLIVGEELIDAFDRQEDAYATGVQRFGNVPLYIRRVQKEDPPRSIPAMTLGFIGARP